MALRTTRLYAETLAEGDGKLRATRLYVEALAAGDGKLRATRLYAEVLSEVIAVVSGTASNALGITDTVVGTAVGSVYGVASDALGLSQVANTEYRVPATSDLGLSDQVSKAEMGIAANDLGIEDDLIFFVHYNAFWPASNSLGLSDTAGSAGDQHPSNDLGLTDSVTGHGPYYESLVHRINFSDSVRSRNFYHTIEQDLGLTDIVPTIHEIDVSNTLTLSDDIERKNPVSSTLGLVQSLLYGKSSGLPAQDLGLSQTVAVSGIWHRRVIDTLGIGQSLTYYFDSGCATRSYTPYSGAETTVPAGLPRKQIEPDGQLRLRVADDLIIIRGPELDNTESNAADRVNRETRGGRLTIFRDPMWPDTATLQLTFQGLEQRDAENLQAFVLRTLGKETVLTDWEGREWTGVITSPDAAIIQNKRWNWSASVTFEGKLVEDGIEGSTLALTDSALYQLDPGRSHIDALNFTQTATGTV